MSAVAISVVSALLFTTLGGGGTQFEGSVGVSAGYDSNVDLAPKGSDVASFGTSTGSVWADGGVSFDLAAATRAYAGVRYDGVAAFDAGDLSHHTFGVDLSLTQEFTDWLALVISPTAGYSLYGDPARSGVRAAIRATLRAYPWSWLSIRAGYGRSQIWASEDVFSLATDRFLAGLEARIARRSYLALAYTLSIGDQVFYVSESAAVPGRGRGTAHRGGGKFSTLVPYKAIATENAISPRFEQGIWDELFVALTYEFVIGSSDQGQYVVHSLLASVGYRF